MTKHIILKTLCGSKLHGLNTPTSDEDWRTVYVESTEKFLSLNGFEKQKGGDGDPQWEVRDFCRMASKCNPTALEVLAAVPTEWTSDGSALRFLFPKFLSRRLVRDAFKGFARSQKNQAHEGGLAPQRQAKFASHYLRVLYSGEHLLLTGFPILNVVGTEAEEPCRSAKFGGMSLDDALNLGAELEARIDVAYERSTLPEEPDLAAIEDYLYRLRVRHLVKSLFPVSY